MLTSTDIRELCKFKEKHDHCGGRGYYMVCDIKPRPSAMPPSNLTTWYSGKSPSCRVACICGSQWRIGDQTQADDDQWLAMDDVSLDLTDHLVRLMKRPSMYLGCFSDTRLQLFLDGAAIAMEAMPSTPRFASFLDAVRKERDCTEGHLGPLIASLDDPSDRLARQDAEERRLTEFLGLCKMKLANEYKDLLVSLIARTDDIAKFYLWF